ncbi:MAG: hypothetical protein ACLQMS_13170 [Desulfomonilaceae bacterium]
MIGQTENLPSKPLLPQIGGVATVKWVTDDVYTDTNCRTLQVSNPHGFLMRLSSAILHADSSARRDLKLEVQLQPQAKAKDALMIDTTTTKNKILATGLYLIVF